MVPEVKAHYESGLYQYGGVVRDLQIGKAFGGNPKLHFQVNELREIYETQDEIDSRVGVDLPKYTIWHLRRLAADYGVRIKQLKKMV